MNNDFLDNQNFSYLINNVRNDVSQKTDFDIFNDKKYVNLFKKLIQTIHTTNMNKTNITKEYLNSVVIDKCVPFLVNQINNDKKKEHIFNLPQPKIETMGRPKSTRVVREKKKNTDFSNLTLDTQFHDLNNRNQSQSGMFLDNSNVSNNITNIAGKSTRDDERIDLMKKMQELENERNYKKSIEDSNSFSNQVQNANIIQQKQINEINQKGIQSDNDFFKKMYENDLQLESNPNPNQNQNPNLQNKNNGEPNKEMSIDKLMIKRNSQFNNNNTQQQQQNYFNNNDDDDDLDSLYQNRSMTLAKQELENPMSPIDLDKYSISRNQELSPSNIKENLNMSINNSTMLNSEDIKEKLNEINLTEENKKDYQSKTFMSTNKVYERRKKRVLSIDISNFLDDIEENRPAIVNYSNNFWHHFKVNFQEDFIVDKITDVFLESITINNPAQASYFNNLYIVIDIDEFNVKTATNNGFMKDKFVLPNENTETSGSNKFFKYHLKSNYIATINPKKLNSLTMRMTNENNQHVGVQLSDSTATVNNVDGYEASSNIIKVSDSELFSIFDPVYNSNKKFIGILSGTHNDNNHLHFNNKTHISLINGEKLYLPHSDIRTNIFSNNKTDIDSLTIAVDNGEGGNSSAVTDFSVGDTVYLGNGCNLGTLSNVIADKLTFESGISISIPDNVRMYKENPLPKVFASNNKNNRIIMEFMFISR